MKIPLFVGFLLAVLIALAGCQTTSGRTDRTAPAKIDLDVYAFIFGQQGLKAGLGLQGFKIIRVNSWRLL